MCCFFVVSEMAKTVLHLLFVTVFLNILVCIFAWDGIGGPCFLPHRASLTGTCAMIRDCPEALKEIKLGETPKLCGFQGIHPIVCCDESKMSANLIPPQTATPQSVTQQNVTPQNVTPENVTQENVTPQSLTPQNVTTQTVTPQSVAPQNVASQNVTPQNVTQQNVTPQNLTTENVTPENVTPENVTPENVTTQNATPQNITPQDLTTQDTPPNNVASQDGSVRDENSWDVSTQTESALNITPMNSTPHNVTPQNVTSDNVPPEDLHPQVGDKPDASLQNHKGNQRKQESISQTKCREYAQHVSGKNPFNVEDPHSAKPRCISTDVPLMLQEMVKVGQFPHLAIIGYEPNPGHITWQCAGALISDQYVLTAAHCLEGIVVGKSKYVRLGTTDLNENNNKEMQRIGISERIPHPLFSFPVKYHDIGLLKLKKPAAFNLFVRPACLNSDFKITQKRAFTVGPESERDFGESTGHLRQTAVEFVPQEECNKTYKTYITRTLKDGIREDSQLCINSTDAIKDSCRGTSGAPLQVHNKDLHCMFDVVGVTSFGTNCRDWRTAEVHSRVSHYIPWIESIVWPISDSPGKGEVKARNEEETRMDNHAYA